MKLNTQINHMGDRFVTVGELMEALATMPQDASVWALYDGFCQVTPEVVYLAKGGHVILKREDEDVYHAENKEAA